LGDSTPAAQSHRFARELCHFSPQDFSVHARRFVDQTGEQQT
jgi:hypothetical protein